MIDSKLISQLRALTGAGIVECSKALKETNGDYDTAVELLRKAGQKVAANKQIRETKEGIVHAYIHSNKKVGVLVEISCETDFVSRNEEFLAFAHDVALHIAAANPLYVSEDEVPAEKVKKEKEIYLDQMKEEKKPDEIKEKIIAGKLLKYYQEICLLSQPFVKDDSVTIGELVTRIIAKTGENVQIRRFVRFAV